MKKPEIDPSNPRNRFHVSLTDGVKTVGLVITDSAMNARPASISRNPTPRTALKTREGGLKYDSFRDPWSIIAQENFIKGRGNLDFDSDATMFNDSFRANTQYGYFSNGPLERYSTGLRSLDQDFPGVNSKYVNFLAIKPGDFLHFASKRTLSATYTAAKLYLIVKRRGTPADATITIRADNAGVPGTVAKTITLSTSTITDIVSDFYGFTIPSNYSAVSGTAIWIDVSTTTADEDNYWSVGVYPKTGSTAKRSVDGTTWINEDQELYFRMTPADDADVFSKFFKYRYTEFCVQSINGGTPKLWMNGDRGMADSNSGQLTKVIDATKSWPADKFKNCVVKAVAGPGSTEYKNWRIIIANDATSLTCDSAWVETHTTDTEYVILGSDDWIEIGSHGITKPVYTDPLVVNNIVYFPQGDATNIRRMAWYTGALAFSDDSTNKAYCLQQVRDATNGLEVWRGQNSDATGLISVSKSAVVDYGTGTTYLSFGTVIPLKDERGRITNIIEYGDTTKVPWVLREGSVYQIVSSKPDEIPLREIATMMDTYNGTSSLVHNIYLYWNMGQGLERYYDKELTDVGPNLKLGLPVGRKGFISSLVGYAGRFFASIDADTGRSSVLVTNLSGWHEIYRAPTDGQRIRAMDFQTIPGTSLDKLWVAVGNDIIALNFPSGGLDPLNDPLSEYVWESTIDLSRFYVGMYDIIKFFRSFKLWADNLSSGQTIEIDYRVGEDTAWTRCDGTLDGETNELFTVEEYGVNGFCIQPRLRIMTNDVNKTVRGKSVVINNISRVPIKYNYGIPFRILDFGMDAYGKPSDLTAEEMLEILDGWATDLTPLIMRCQYKTFDRKVVFIDPIPLNPTAAHSEKYLGRLTIIEI